MNFQSAEDFIQFLGHFDDLHLLGGVTLHGSNGLLVKRALFAWLAEQNSATLREIHQQLVGTPIFDDLGSGLNKLLQNVDDKT